KSTPPPARCSKSGQATPGGVDAREPRHLRSARAVLARGPPYSPDEARTHGIRISTTTPPPFAGSTEKWWPAPYIAVRRLRVLERPIPASHSRLQSAASPMPLSPTVRVRLFPPS